MLPEKLPKPPFFSKEKMTEEDWKYYFECRKKYDKPILWDINSKLAETFTQMQNDGKSENECIKYLEEHNYALMPKAALAAKHVHGFKYIAKCNLYFAKTEYPEEF